MSKIKRNLKKTDGMIIIATIVLIILIIILINLIFK
jgi:hypothetical protein